MFYQKNKSYEQHGVAGVNLKHGYGEEDKCIYCSEVYNYIYLVKINKSNNKNYCQPLSSYSKNKIAIRRQRLDLLPEISSYNHNIDLSIMDNDRMQVARNNLYKHPLKYVKVISSPSIASRVCSHKKNSHNHKRFNKRGTNGIKKV